MGAPLAAGATWGAPPVVDDAGCALVGAPDTAAGATAAAAVAAAVLTMTVAGGATWWWLLTTMAGAVFGRGERGGLPVGENGGERV